MSCLLHWLVTVHIVLNVGESETDVRRLHRLSVQLKVVGEEAEAEGLAVC